MRIKLNVTLDCEAEAKPNESTVLKTVHFIDESVQAQDQKVFTIKHLLKDISKKLGVEKKAEMSAELEGYSIPNNYPATKILREDDVVGVTFKSKVSLVPTSRSQTPEAKQITRPKRKFEESVNKNSPSNPITITKDNEEKKKSSISEPKEETEASAAPANKLSKSQKRNLRRIRTIKAMAMQEMPSKLNLVEDLTSDPPKPTAVKQEHIDNISDYASLPAVSLSSAPLLVEKWIAFKMMELGLNYCPGLSDFKRAKVLAFDADTEMISLQVAEAHAEPQYDENGEVVLRRFELPESFTNLDNGVEVEYLVNDVDAIKVVPFSFLEDVRKLPW